MQRSALCRSRRELSNAYLLAKFGFDTAENEPFQVCPLSAYRSPRYLVNTDNSGTTLMWHGLSTKYRANPDLIRIIEDIDAQGVAYLYLPLNHWEKSRVSCGKCRNKGRGERPQAERSC